VLRTQRDGSGGGLVVDVKGRNYVLVDRMESAIDFGLSAEKRPPDGRSPTWLCRRREWRPESASAR